MIKSEAGKRGIATRGAGENIDWLISAGLAMLVLVTRLPFRTSMLYNWDSANFALGTRYFDVSVHAPHPPGYFFYVAVGKLVNLVTGEANASFVSLSALFSIGAVIITYFLGKAMFGRQAGLIASLLLTFSVTFWSYGGIALAYPSLAFFSSLVALFGWRIINGEEDSNSPAEASTSKSEFPGGRGFSRFGDFTKHKQLGFPLLLSVAYALGSGFRPDLLLFLGPLWLWCLWLQSWRTRVICAMAALAGFLLWLVPTALLSGGFAQYFAVFSAYTQTDVAARYSSTNKGFAGLFVNVRDTLAYAFYALYAAALPLGFAALWLLTRRKLWPRRESFFFLVWVVPMLVFYIIIHIGDPGYVFTFLPAIVVLLGAFLSKLPPLFAKSGTGFPAEASTSRSGSPGGRDFSRFVPFPTGNGPRGKVSLGVLVAIAVVAVNAGVFLLHPRLMTAQGIRQHDLAYQEKMAYIGSQATPGSTLLLTYDSYKHLLYYLPEYRQSIWVDVFADAEAQVPIPKGVKAILLVDERLNGINRSKQVTGEIDLPSGRKMHSLSVKEGQVLRVGGKVIEVHD